MSNGPYKTLKVVLDENDAPVGFSGANDTDLTQFVTSTVNPLTGRIELFGVKLPVDIIAQSAVQVSHTGDTAEFILAHVLVPAGSMGPNGRIIVNAAWSTTNNANTKTYRINFGGPAGTNATYSVGLANIAYNTVSPRCVIANRNSNASQVCTPNNSAGGSSTTVPKTMTVDTSVDQYLDITGQLSVGSDTIALEWFDVVVEYGA